MQNKALITGLQKEIARLGAQKAAHESALAILVGTSGMRTMRADRNHKRKGKRGRPPGARNKPGYKKPGPKPGSNRSTPSNSGKKN